MTKRFCDLCGKPAVDFWPKLRVDFPDQTWRGTKSEGISCVDGTWTPHVEARLSFEVHEMPDSRQIRPHNPDLCGYCVADLLMKMSIAVSKDQTGA